MSLQDLCEKFAHDLRHLPLPYRVLVMSDLHAGAGDEHDPLKACGKESLVIDVLREYHAKDYALFVSEVWDTWRGFSLEAIYKAHSDLANILNCYVKYHCRGNHERDLLYRPEVFIFEGFGKRIFFDHGYLFDWPNCRGWHVGRLAVRAAMGIGVDPETSPHPSNPDRHLVVKTRRQELADNNPDWTFIQGHTHNFESVRNHHDSGSPITGHVTGFLIEEGEIIGKEWV